MHRPNSINISSIFYKKLKIIFLSYFEKYKESVNEYHYQFILIHSDLTRIKKKTIKIKILINIWGINFTM